jgi:membrane protease YdiL (CAAX protease family)
LAVIALVQGLALVGVFGGIAVLFGSATADLWMARLAVASTPATALALLATFLPLIAGLGLTVRVVHRRGFRSVLGARPLRDALRAATVTFLVFSPLILAAMAMGATQPNLPPALWLALLPLACVGIAVQTLAEEALFRGYLMQQLAARFASPWVWVPLPALAFAGLHFDPGSMGAAASVVVVMAALFGLLAADLTARSGGIGLAWGLHFANNAVGLVFLATQGGITGLALRVTDHHQNDMASQPALALAGAVPMVLAWAILRWRLRD